MGPQPRLPTQPHRIDFSDSNQTEARVAGGGRSEQPSMTVRITRELHRERKRWHTASSMHQCICCPIKRTSQTDTVRTPTVPWSLAHKQRWSVPALYLLRSISWFHSLGERDVFVHGAVAPPLHSNHPCIVMGGGGKGTVIFHFANLCRRVDIEFLWCICWLAKVVSLGRCCALQGSCIQGTPLYPVSCRTLRFS